MSRPITDLTKIHKPVLITGTNGGIGLSTALYAARRSWPVVATVRHSDNIEIVEEAMDREGLQCDVLELDITNEQQCIDVIEAVQPYALVNNAGVGGAGAVEEVSSAKARELLEIMTVGPMRLASLCLPHMRAGGGGRIINVSSLGGLTSAPLTGWYSASKHALETLSDSLRMEVAADNIKVSLIEPGGVPTDILKKSQGAIENVETSRFAQAYERAARLTRLTYMFRSDTNKVARAIVRAIESENPRRRYLIGLDARLLITAGRLSPESVRDRFKQKALGL